MSIDTRLKKLERQRDYEPVEFEPLSDEERLYRLSAWCAAGRLRRGDEGWWPGSMDDMHAVRIAGLLNLAEQRRAKAVNNGC